MTPVSGQAIVEITSPVPTLVDGPSTDQTFSGMHPQSQSQTMTRAGQTNSLKGAMIGIAGIVVVLSLAVVVVIDPKAESNDEGPPADQPSQIASKGLPTQKGGLPEPGAQPAKPIVAEEKPDPQAPAGEQVAAAPSNENEKTENAAATEAKASNEKRSARSSRRSSRNSSKRAEKASSKKPAASEKAAAASAATKRIRARGPASVIWKSASGKTLGRGSAPLDVPKGITALQAVDGQTGGKNTVPIINRVADYDSLGKGRVVFRVRPWAEIRIGKKNYGTTPIDPIRLVAGTYRIKLKWEDKTITKTVRVRKGQQESLKVDMRK